MNEEKEWITVAVAVVVSAVLAVALLSLIP